MAGVATFFCSDKLRIVHPLRQNLRIDIVIINYIRAFFKALIEGIFFRRSSRGTRARPTSVVGRYAEVIAVVAVDVFIDYFEGFLRRIRAVNSVFGYIGIADSGI